MGKSHELGVPVAFPTQKEVRAVEAEQTLIPEGWQPYQNAADVLAQSYEYTDRWDQPHYGWIEYDCSRTYRGQGPIKGKPVRKALLGLIEADTTGTLEPPLSDSLRGLLGNMRQAINDEVERQLDGVGNKHRDKLRKMSLSNIDEQWFADDGRHRKAAMRALKIAVNHGIVT